MRRVRHVRSRADRPPEARDRGSETRVAAWSGRHSTYRSVAFRGLDPVTADRLIARAAAWYKRRTIQARSHTDARPLPKPRTADIPTLRIVQLMEYGVLPPPARTRATGSKQKESG